jgi:hypothetical protein
MASLWLFLFCSVAWAKLDHSDIANLKRRALEPVVALETKQNDIPLFAYRYIAHENKVNYSSTVKTFYNQTQGDFVNTFNSLTPNGWKLIDINPYNYYGVIWYTSVFQYRPDNYGWYAYVNMNAGSYQQTFNTLTSKGFRPLKVRCVPAGNPGCGSGHCYSAIFDNSPLPYGGTGWVANHEILSQNYQGYFNSLIGQGYFIQDVCGCQDSSNGNVYYAAWWVKPTWWPGWFSRNAMSLWDYQAFLGHSFTTNNMTIAHINLMRVNGNPQWNIIVINQGPVNGVYTWPQYYASLSILIHDITYFPSTDGAQFLEITAC